MPSSPPSPGRVEPPIVAEAPAEFSADAAFRTPGFLEFMQKFGDYETASNDDAEVENRFKIFKGKEQLKTDVKFLFQKQIQEEMNIKLGAKELGSISDRIETMAIDQPKEFLELKAKLDRFKELPAEIAAKEQELAQLGGAEDWANRLTQAEEDQEHLTYAQEGMGVFGRMTTMIESATIMARRLRPWANILSHYSQNIEPAGPEYRAETARRAAELQKVKDGVKAVRAKYGKINMAAAAELAIGAGASIDAAEARLNTIVEKSQERDEAKKEFAAIRKEILGSAGDIQELTSVVRSKATTELDSLVSKGTFESLEGALKRFEELKKISTTTETKVNVTGRFDEATVRKNIEDMLENLIAEKIADALKSSDVGSTILVALEKAVADIRARGKVGSMEADEVVFFIGAELSNVEATLGQSNADKVKRMVIARMRKQLS